jgi:hypothetical protein
LIVLALAGDSTTTTGICNLEIWGVSLGRAP